MCPESVVNIARSFSMCSDHVLVNMTFNRGEVVKDPNMVMLIYICILTFFFFCCVRKHSYM